MWFSSLRRSGFSVLEIVIAITLFLVAMVPIVSLFTQVNRTSYASNRLLDATLHGQLALEAILELEPDELPALADTDQKILFDDVTGLRLTGGPRWDEIIAYLSLPPPFPMSNRRIVAETFGDPGKISITVEIRWLRVAQDENTSRSIELRGVSSPRGWR